MLSSVFVEPSSTHAEAGSDANDARGLFRVEPLHRTFYVVARARELRKKPLRVVVWGRPYVLFRSAAGVATAFADRCPHRNVPLSSGRVDERGRIECPYHGWCFDERGRCVEIPGRVLPIAPEARAFAAEKFEVREEQGFIWLCPSPEGPLAEPFVLPHADDARYTHVVREVRAEASLYAVIENALDVPHTAILHRGLFRGGKRTRIRARVERHADRVVTEYVGEPPPKGLLARLLALGSSSGALGLTVQHWDKFFLPSVLQVEYRLGDATHFVITGLCTPVDRHETRLFAVASFRTPVGGRWLAWILEPVGRLVFRQDARLLAAHTENVLRFGGERFISTELDALGPPLFRVIQAAARREKKGLSLADVPEEAPHVHEFEIEA